MCLPSPCCGQGGTCPERSYMDIRWPPWRPSRKESTSMAHLSSITSTDKMFTDCPSVYCQYLGINDMPCSELITCNDVSQHFNTVHGIKGMTREVEFLCRRPNCGQTIIRHNFVRHIREVHHLSEVYAMPLRIEILRVNSQPRSSCISVFFSMLPLDVNSFLVENFKAVYTNCHSSASCLG
ncbi:hypothetical protein V8B97DRAFT_1279270 [Scleroderma yunnanense]